MAYNYTMPLTAPLVDAIAGALLRQWQPPRQPSLSRTRRTLAARGQNDLSFTGILTRLDTPSDRPPQGSSGHLVEISSALARRTLDQLASLPVNLSSDLQDHQKRQIVGVLDKGWIDGDRLIVQGRLFDKNQGDLIAQIQQNKDHLGMSFELGEAEVENTSAPVWRLTNLTWTGCALLNRANAAYEGTAISLAAAAWRR